MERSFDLIVIGSGAAGTAAAGAAREAGAKRVAIIEGARRLGGECPNNACVPTKALLRSVDTLREAREAGSFGVRISGVAADFKKMMQRKQVIVDTLTKPPRIENQIKKMGVELVRGPASFVDPHTVKAGGRIYQAKKFVIAAGSENFITPIEGLKEAGYLTSDRLINAKRPPASLIIIGAGPVGSEFAQIFAPLGTKVSLVEFGPHILSREEPEIAQAVMESFRAQGITILTNSKAVKVEKRGAERVVTVAPADPKSVKAARVLRAEAVMVAVGKRPAIGRLRIERAGVKLNERGAPVLNEFLRTSVPHIYFAGDAAGQMLFTHVAHYQGEVAGTNAVKGNRTKSDLSVVPRATFVHPEVGSVGITEAEARKKGYQVGVGIAPLRVLGRALTSGKSAGLVKIVVDKKTKRVLGGGVAGTCAGELAHEIALAMYAKIPYTKLAEMIHAYPTWSEAVGIAAYEVK